MIDARCREMRLLIQAELDGELDTASIATLAAHVATCPGCANERRHMSALSSRLHDDLTYYAAPAALRQSLELQLAAARHSSLPAAGDLARAGAHCWQRLVAAVWIGDRCTGRGCRDRCFSRARHLASARQCHHGAVGCGPYSRLAAGTPDGCGLDRPAHGQALVRWEAGFLTAGARFFVAEGFPLLGGRLDYLGGQPVAALVYGRAKHVIDLYVWPAGRSAPRLPASTERNGYNVIHWTQGGMSLTAISDAAEPALQDFVKLWKAGGDADAENTK